MANPKHVKILAKGVKAWNSWRRDHPGPGADLSGEDLSDEELAGLDLRNADLTGASFSSSDLSDADLRDSTLQDTDFSHSGLNRTKFAKATVCNTNFYGVDMVKANLSGARFSGKKILTWSDLSKANFRGVYLRKAKLHHCKLEKTKLNNADLRSAQLRQAQLLRSDLTEAKLARADLSGAVLVGTVLNGANLTGCRAYGTSVWDIIFDEHTTQTDLVITPPGKSSLTVDNLEVAQFVYLVLNNEKLRDVIEALSTKAVLILGRFTPERKKVLEAIRRALRERGYLPIVFDFQRPTNRDFTETIKLLAGMSRFIVADITQPKSTPLELQAIIPDYMIPFVTLIQKGERPFSMFQDLWQKHPLSVVKPVAYTSVEQLVKVFDRAIVQRANSMLRDIQRRKAEQLTVIDASEYE